MKCTGGDLNEPDDQLGNAVCIVRACLAQVM